MSCCHIENTEVARVGIFTMYWFAEFSIIAFVRAPVPFQHILIQTSDDKWLISDTTFHKTQFYYCKIVNMQLQRNLASILCLLVKLQFIASTTVSIIT